MRLSPHDRLGFLVSGGLAFAHFIARRYEQALRWADRCLHEQPRHASALRIRVAACSYLGKMDEAHRSLERLLEYQPELTIASCNAFYKKVSALPKIVILYIQGLRKAGLPAR
jgi:tetratricopeptide (TPR) repeat protein